MTDILGLLYAIHHALNECGDLHLAITQLEGMAGVVDRYTNTIHISPGLTLPEMLRVLADAVGILDPPTAVVEEPIAVGGADPGALVLQLRHLSVVPGTAL